jgi:hypothetical protein
MNMSNYTIYFDMDGTIADLYAVDNWLEKLKAEDVSPYLEAAPLVDMSELTRLLGKAMEMGYRLGVISWLSREASQEYKKKIRAAKRAWLEENLDVDFDEIHLVQYGTRKDYVAQDKQGMLFDDDERVRNNWKGFAINPEETNMIDFLKFIVMDE